MCIGGLMNTPDAPKVPERQAVQAPRDPARDRTADMLKRRRGMMATILTSSAGALQPASTTATAATGAGKPYLG